ncbi:MAG: archaeosine biosynthesis radical SAM protein RaSEA [Candidatus Njordarchaeia archaeon]
MMNSENVSILTEILRINKELREIGFRNVKPKTGPNRPVGFWTEKEPVRIDGELRNYDALVIILGTRGCRWAHMGNGGGCIFCGYVYKNPRFGGNLIKQIEFVYSRKRLEANKIKVIKIFTSGSFLDDFELNAVERKLILEKLLNFYPNLEILQLESRPEHILIPGRLDEFKKFDVEIYFNVGLESANDDVLRLINKGFMFNTYERALKKAHENGYKMKTYLMLKQPFQTEMEAINDTIYSGIKVLEMGTDSLSINPMVVYSYTFVEFLWKQGLYRPPWLNSVLYVVKKLLENENAPKSIIMSDPVAPGSKRGAHSCSSDCDRKLNRALEEMVAKQDPEINIPNCCAEVWNRFMMEEHVKKDLSYNSLVP